MTTPTDSATFDKTTLNRVRRMPERGHYDADTIYPIIDAALICHLGFVEDGRPFVIPTMHARMGDALVLHGAKASRLLKHAAAGNDLCVTITILDGLVMARSVFHHAMNYRSAVLFGKGELIDDPADRMHAFEVLTEHIMPGRWADARLPNDQELSATTLVRMPINIASAKVRTGPPVDDDDDYVLDIWAGVVPIRQQMSTPLADPKRTHDVAVPGYVQRYWQANAAK